MAEQETGPSTRTSRFYAHNQYSSKHNAAVAAAPTHGRMGKTESGMQRVRKLRGVGRLVVAQNRIAAAPRSRIEMRYSMPLPAGLSMVLFESQPEDASCFERLRDNTLWVFAHPRVYTAFTVIAITMAVLVCLDGLLTVYSMFGLYFALDNGWNEYDAACVELARRENVEITPMYIAARAFENATLAAEYDGRVPQFCTLNQYFFNLSVKVYVWIFSYTNFLPIPWRLAILHHATCSSRSHAPGRDFYGRDTAAMWFNLPSTTRLRCAILLNLAYVLHFGCVAGHSIYASYLAGQTWPGAFFQNCPFLLSIVCAIAAGVIQGKAEDALIKAHPELYPPRLNTFLKQAVRQWRRGEGKLRKLVKEAMRQWHKACDDASEASGGKTLGLTGVTQLRKSGSFDHGGSSSNLFSSDSSSPAPVARTPPSAPSPRLPAKLGDIVQTAARPVQLPRPVPLTTPAPAPTDAPRRLQRPVPPAACRAKPVLGAPSSAAGRPAPSETIINV